MIVVPNSNALELLAERKGWTLPTEIAMKTTSRPELVPTLLRTLADRGLAETKPHDENGWFYRISPAGDRHLTETRTHRRISSFPPPRISWLPVQNCA